MTESGSPNTVELSEDEVKLANTLAVLRNKVQSELRLVELKEAELVELRRQNELAQRREAWVRDLGSKVGQAVDEMRLARQKFETSIEALTTIIREFQEEQAKIDDHIIDVLNRLRDGLSYLLARANGGKSERFRQAIEDLPGQPEDRELYESLKKQKAAGQRRLNKLLEEVARSGQDPARQIQIEDLENDLCRLDVEIRKLS